MLPQLRAEEAGRSGFVAGWPWSNMSGMFSGAVGVSCGSEALRTASATAPHDALAVKGGFCLHHKFAFFFFCLTAKTFNSFGLLWPLVADILGVCKQKQSKIHIGSVFCSNIVYVKEISRMRTTSEGKKVILLPLGCGSNLDDLVHVP